jgi:hypothetical protein
MKMKNIGIWTVCFLIAMGTFLIPTSLESAQGGAAPTPTNLQILPQDVDIRMVMQNISQALGVTCTHCHIQGEFASDEVPQKEVARNMMRMVRTINSDFLGEGTATCLLCHRGEAIPDPSR